MYDDVLNIDRLFYLFNAWEFKNSLSVQIVQSTSLNMWMTGAHMQKKTSPTL